MSGLFSMRVTITGKVDYEMEMEVRSLELGEPVFLGILEKYKIERRQAESKIKRALSTR